MSNSHAGPRRLSNLPNLGPKSEAMFALTGIHTVGELRALGAVRAYLLVKRTCGGASLNLLWAIEGALSQRSWQEVARDDRLRLLTELEMEESQSDIPSYRV